MSQVFPYKDGDTVKESQVYRGPLGDGYFDIEYKVTDGILMKKVTHVGPEVRNEYDWTALEARPTRIQGTVLVHAGLPEEMSTAIESSFADPIILILNEECIWIEDIGLQLSESYKATKIAELEAI